MSRLSSLIRPALLALLLAPAGSAGAATVHDLDLSTILGVQEGPLDRALGLIGSGRPDEAEAIAREVIAATPDSAPAHEVLGAALALQDRVPEAIDALRAAVERDPGQFTAWTKLGDIAQALGDEDQAVALYRRALAIAPDDRLTNQRIGLHLAAQGAVDAAIAHLEKGVIGLPEDTPGLRLDLARQYLRAGRPQAALDLLARWNDAAGQVRPSPAAALAILGEALLATGAPEPAAARFRAVVADHPDDIAALAGLGRAERALGAGAASVAALTRAAQLAPDDAALQIELATSEAADGQGEAAIARLDRLLDDDGATVATLAGAARLYGGMGRYDKAREGFERAIAADPDDPALRAGLTVALLRLGDVAAALEQARRRLDLAPGDADAAFMAGMLEESTGDRDAAVAHYQQALTLAPDHWPSLNNLAIMRLSEGRVADALALAQQAEQTAADNPIVLDTLAQIYEADGDGDRAAEARLQIGETYLDAGNPAEARKALEAARASATDPALLDRIAARLQAL